MYGHREEDAMEKIYDILHDRLPPRIVHPHDFLIEKMGEMNLTADDILILAEHVSACGQCRQRLQQIRASQSRAA